MNMKGMDRDHQPVNRFFNRKQRIDRDLDELIGITKGLVADDIVTQSEAEFLLGWLRRNAEVCNHGIGLSLYNRVAEMLEDGYLDQAESVELLGLLRQFSGQIPLAEQVENLATSLPLDRPFPAITFADNIFCLTGQFLSGSRKECEEVILALGGQCHPRVTSTVNYLVVGNLGSIDWVHTTFGRKIEQALTIKQKGHPIFIVGEDHWAQRAYGIDPGLAQQV
jgi:hypothetical protein